MDFKVKGTSQILSVLGTIKGEIEFDEGGYTVKSSLGLNKHFTYDGRSEYTPLIYMGYTNVRGLGNAQIFLFLFRKSL